MKKLWLVIGASALDEIRWARQHLYILLILTPLVLGISYATVSRLASEAPRLQLSFPISLVLCVGLVLGLIGLSLSRAAGEIYHLRKPESVLDYLPVSLSTQLHAACLKRATRTLAIGVLVLIIRALLGFGTKIDASVILQLLIFVLIMSLAEAVSALSWIHWAHVRNKVTALYSLSVILMSAIFAALLLIMIVGPSLLPVWIDRWLVTSNAVWVMALYFLTRELHRCWRASDIEFAKRLQSSGGVDVFGASVLRRRFPPDLAVQLARDLQLTLRGFSSAVYVALFIFVLLLIALITVLLTDWLPSVATTPKWFDATWLPAVMATKIACVLATASNSILVAVMVAYQLPHFWLERAAGVTGRQMWESKLWYSRVVGLASPLAVWLIALVSGTVPLFYAVPLLLECIWLWWIVSTIIGALTFEIPDRPELAIILMISFGAMFGLFVTIFWPIGIAFFALNGVRGLTTRGHARANFCLMTEDD